MTITAGKVFAAKVRAADHAFYLKMRKPYMGGYSIPTSGERDAYIAGKFRIPIREVSGFFTYSRSCTHAWSAGACAKCPDTDHLWIPSDE